MLNIRYLLAGLALAATWSLATASPPEVQADYKTTAGQNLRIVVKGKDVDWKATFSDEEAFFDQLTATKDGELRFVFQATKDGVYYVTLWTLNEKGSGVVIKIVVGPPPPPPKPPEPPPGPDDPKKVRLREAIREALKRDSGARKETVAIAAVYKELAKMAEGGESMSSVEFLRRAKKAAELMIGEDKLFGVRSVVADELKTLLGNPSEGVLSPEVRKALAALFRLLAEILDTL